MKKRLISLLCCFLPVLGLSACGKAQITLPFDKSIQSEYVADYSVENDRFKMECNRKNYGISVTDKQTGEKYGTSPEENGKTELDEFGLPKERNYSVESPFLLDYLEYASNTEVSAVGYDAVTEGRVRCRKIKNGLEIEYYLDSVEIMIPIDYILYDDYIRVSVNPNKIKEDKNKVISISLAPFWCSCENGEENSYLFVPSGSGALVSTKTRSDTVNKFSAPVYGEDYCMEKVSQVSSDKNILLPVFGSKNASRGNAAIIENGAENASICVNAGDGAVGYSTVYVSFDFRGYTRHTSTQFSSNKVESTIYSERRTEKTVSVRYYPLSKEKSTYMGMAECYRNYLQQDGKMKKGSEDRALGLTILGGTVITQSFLGIPYDSLFATSTLADSYGMLREIISETGIGINVKLKGFGVSGTSVKNIAGGYKIAKRLGSRGDLKKIKEYLGKNGSNLYFDFDLMRYSSSSAGFSSYFDSITNTGYQKAYQYKYDIAVHSKNSESLYYLLKPDKFLSAAEKLADKTGNWGIDGFSSETLSGMLYSDYSDRSSSDYYVRSKTEKAVTKALLRLKTDGKKFMATSANAYAAKNADIIFDAPTESTGAYLFEADIPFYEIVFKGYIPMAAESVNLKMNYTKSKLRAIECGIGLQYTLISEWDNTLIGIDEPLYFNSEYAAVKDLLISDIKEAAPYYEKISGAAISGHRILENGLRETTFDNGVTVYVNYSDGELISPLGRVGSHGYVYGEEKQ